MRFDKSFHLIVGESRTCINVYFSLGSLTKLKKKILPKTDKKLKQF